MVSTPLQLQSGNESGYEIIAELGRDEIGIVYLCRHTREAGFQRLYAVKSLHPHLAGDETFSTLFVDRARLVARIHHPNVVGIADLGRSHDGYFVVMEYVKGCSLAEMLARLTGALPPRLLVSILLDVLRGLHAAHTICDFDGQFLPLVHGDVGAKNILIGMDGVARVTDFAIAKIDRSVIADAEKPAYAAPERLRDGPEAADGRTDVFSVGALMWNTSVGWARLPSSLDTLLGIRSQIEIPPPSTAGRRPPACLDAICLRALQLDPRQRYPSAEAMAEELRRVASKNDLLGDPQELGRLVQQVFAPELEDRREAIRDARLDPVAAPAQPLALSRPPRPRARGSSQVSPQRADPDSITAVDGAPRSADPGPGSEPPPIPALPPPPPPPAGRSRRAAPPHKTGSPIMRLPSLSARPALPALGRGRRNARRKAPRRSGLLLLALAVIALFAAYQVAGDRLMQELAGSWPTWIEQLRPPTSQPPSTPAASTSRVSASHAAAPPQNRADEEFWDQTFGRAANPASEASAGDAPRRAGHPHQAPAREPPDSSHAPMPAAFNTVAITSVPPGAKIYLDGKPQGHTPAHLDVRGDSHSLALVLRGYKLHLAKVGSSSAVASTLEPAAQLSGPARLKIRCREKGRYWVIVDGQDLGKACPTGRIGVEHGPHVVEIYDPLTQDWRVFYLDIKDTRNSVRLRVDREHRRRK